MQDDIRDDHDDLARLRNTLVDRLKTLGVLSSSRIEEAVRTIPRHLFLPEESLERVYSDTSLLAMQRDTQPVSVCAQPSTAILMLEMLAIEPGQRILEIGTGTGYTAALLAHLVGETGSVVTIDVDEQVVSTARRVLNKAGMSAVQTLYNADGLDLQKDVTYDRILVNALVDDIAPAWKEQLASGGCLVLPLLLTPFQSAIATPPDQFLLALRPVAGYLESTEIRAVSLDVHPASFAQRAYNFLPLQGAFAPRQKAPLQFVDHPTILCNAIADIDVHTASNALKDFFQNEPTDVAVSFAEIGGLRRWLALSEEAYCELYVQGEAAMESLLPPLFRMSPTFLATIGLYEQGSWYLLNMEEDLSPTKDRQRPFKLSIRSFGENNALAQRLKKQISRWDSAGRPFRWTPQLTMEHLSIRASSIQQPLFPQPHEVLLSRPSTYFVFIPQIQTADQETDSANTEVSQPEESKRTEEETQPLWAILKEGKERWNQWKKAHPDVIANLVGLDLQGAVLKELDLSRVRLNGANLAKADLFGSDLSGAHLQGANLSGVKGANVNLSGANLSGADLSWAFLVKSNLNGASLNGANLRSARVKGVSLLNADLSGVDFGQTHLNRVDLDGSNLSGAQFDDTDFQQTGLPDISAYGMAVSDYREKCHSLPFSSAEATLDARNSKNFSVQQTPRVFIRDTGAVIHIRTWNKRSIGIETDGALPQVQQDQDSVYITGGDHAFDLWVPRIPYGIVKLVRHGSLMVTTEVTGEHLSGNLIIEDTGKVTLNDIQGHVSLRAITGDVLMKGCSQGVTLTQITGNIQLEDVSWASIDVVRGNIEGQRIQQALYCGEVAGNYILRESAQAEAYVSRVGGNLQIHGILQGLNCSVGGNVDLQGAFAPGYSSYLNAGGFVTIVIPEDTHLQLGVTAGRIISGEALGGGPNREKGRFASLTYGSGLAKMDITAGGNVHLVGSGRPV